MPVRYLSDPELAQLSSWPDEIAVQDAVTYFTLSTDDLSWLAGFNRQHNRLRRPAHRLTARAAADLRHVGMRQVVEMRHRHLGLQAGK